MALSFEGRVAVVTGAGNGLGKAYALELARRGCAVCVNDLGGSVKGDALEEDAPRPADLVVEEIVAAGGKAVASECSFPTAIARSSVQFSRVGVADCSVDSLSRGAHLVVSTADYDSVEYGAQIIDTAVAAFGTVDILINNAGILRDKSFRRMSDADWELIMTVHLKGVFSCTKAAWDIMYEQGFGRIVNVASPAGLYGNVGQANYSTAKMGMVGLTQTLAKEARRAKRDINVNCIAPLAGTRMLESIYPPELVKLLKVEHIVSLVLYLSHGSNAETGSVIECSGGAYQKVQLARATGYVHDLSKGDPTVEDVAENFERIVDMRDHSLADHETMMPGSMKGIRNVASYVAWTPSEWIKVLSSAGGWALEQLTGGRGGGGSAPTPKL